MSEPIPECGCVIEPIDHSIGDAHDFVIVFCPLHSAAPDLLAACKVSAELLGENTPPFVRNAIAKAKGGAK